MKMSVEGQVAVVTGGTQGLGAAIARALAKAGATVVVWDIAGTERDERSRGEPAEPFPTFACDVADEASVTAAASETAAGIGTPTILVNNAGIAGPHAALTDLPPAQWRRVLDVNLTGTYLTCRALLPGMRERNYGRIVNIASVAGKEGNPFIAAYSASKAGVIALTKSLGKELAETEIRANCITPGAIRTAIFDAWPDDYVASLLAKIPLGRFGRSEELAALTLFLASPLCSFSTGAVFDLSGGRATY